MRWSIKFRQPSRLPFASETSSVSWLFPFTLIDSTLIGTPEEEQRTSLHDLIVKVDIVLVRACFGTDSEGNNQTKKVLFEYGKRHTIRKLQGEGTLAPREEFVLADANTETLKLFDPTRIDDPAGASYEISIGFPQDQPGIINITATGDVNVGGDIIGRDKIISG